MPLLWDWSTFSGTMDASDVSDIFVNTDAGVESGIYNVIHEIDDDNLRASPDLYESLFQFLPFPGAGGHDHDGGVSSVLADGAVGYNQINKQESTLIETGIDDMFLNKGSISVPINVLVLYAQATAVIFYGTSALTIGSTGSDFTSAPSYTAQQWVTVVLSSSDTNDDWSMNIFLERVTAPNVFRVWVFLDGSGSLPSSVDVDFLAIGKAT